jgi:hypothetical protein
VKNLIYVTKVIFVVLLFLFATPAFAEDAPPAKDLQVAGWIDDDLSAAFLSGDGQRLNCLLA